MQRRYHYIDQEIHAIRQENRIPQIYHLAYRT
jgi:hypothetical protein